MKYKKILLVALTASFLAGCGGGSSGTQTVTGPVASTLSFPLQSGYRTIVANGLTKNFSISGSCSGSGNKSSAAATTAATFEGLAGFSSTSTLTMTFTNCTPASTAVTSTSYFDSNYVPHGFNSPGVNYGVYLTAPFLPTTVTVGATAIVGTETLYTNSSKSTPNGSINLSYVVAADTENTAIVNLIAKIYNVAGTLTATEQNRYQISATGTLTPTTTDIQYANGSTSHLVFTYTN